MVFHEVSARWEGGRKREREGGRKREERKREEGRGRRNKEKGSLILCSVIAVCWLCLNVHV